MCDKNTKQEPSHVSRQLLFPFLLEKRICERLSGLLRELGSDLELVCLRDKRVDSSDVGGDDGLGNGQTGSMASEDTVATVIPPESVETVELSGTSTEDIFTDRDLDASFSKEDSIPIVLDGDAIICDSGAVEISGTAATIRKEGTYLISGSLDDGCIIIDAGKTEKGTVVCHPGTGLRNCNTQLPGAAERGELYSGHRRRYWDV